MKIYIVQYSHGEYEPFLNLRGFKDRGEAERYIGSEEIEDDLGYCYLIEELEVV